GNGQYQNGAQYQGNGQYQNGAQYQGNVNYQYGSNFQQGGGYQNGMYNMHNNMREAGDIMALGVASIIMSICFFAVVSLICGIIGLSKAKNVDSNNQDMAVGTKVSNGRICCVIGIVISSLRILLFVLIVLLAIAEG
ncbi:hypothetical protein, partial [Lachnobacterium bovis]